MAESPVTPTPDNKRAPARSDGLCAYVVEEYSWGRTHGWIEWAATLKDAKAHFGWTRQMYTTRKVRRATVGDLATLPDYSREVSRG